ncbi:MAG: CNNM domain-containing protein, partial [Bacteroidota bacterium]|nr:CNNM domain-containing protein [Bacteroidota bacterium]
MSYLIVILISLFLSAFFSGMEIAFVSSNKLRLELSKKKEGFTSQILSIYTENPGQYIVTMLIGNNIALVVYGIIMAMILEPVIHTFTNSNTSVLVIQTIISTLLILVVAEFIPKAIFRINANGLLKIFSIPIFIFYLIFYPISKFTIWLSRIILRVFMRIKLTEGSDDRVFGKPDLDYLVNEAQEDSALDQEEDSSLKIFQNALDLSRVKLRECMIPRTELIALDETTSVEELRQIFIESGLSKILIFKESIDNIIGYVNMKD